MALLKHFAKYLFSQIPLALVAFLFGLGMGYFTYRCLSKRSSEADPGEAYSTKETVPPTSGSVRGKDQVGGASCEE